VRARYRESLTDPTPITPGEVYQYRIELGPLGVRISAGHRLRVDISSSDFPLWDRNLNTGNAFAAEGLSAAVAATQVVLHDRVHPSRITLPIVR
jgi:predicted acyl esterase